MTSVNKASVADSTQCYNLGVCTSKPAAKPLVRQEQPSALSAGDKIWQGTKSGLKMAAWTAPSAIAGMFTSPSYNKFGEAAGVNIAIGLAPAAIGFVSGTVSAITGKEDKVGQTMKKLSGGPATALNVGFKAGIVANGMMMPNLAADALRASSKPLARYGAALGTGLVTVGTTAAAAHVGAKFAKTSASTGGVVFSGAAGGALVGGGGAFLLEVGRHAISGSLKSEGDIKGAVILGLLYGAAAGITGALVEKAHRKAA
jgi:hypothetical protein